MVFLKNSKKLYGAENKEATSSASALRDQIFNGFFCRKLPEIIMLNMFLSSRTVRRSCVARRGSRELLLRAPRAFHFQTHKLNEWLAKELETL